MFSRFAFQSEYEICGLIHIHGKGMAGHCMDIISVMKQAVRGWSGKNLFAKIWMVIRTDTLFISQTNIAFFIANGLRPNIWPSPVICIVHTDSYCKQWSLWFTSKIMHSQFDIFKYLENSSPFMFLCQNSLIKDTVIMFMSLFTGKWGFWLL